MKCFKIFPFLVLSVLLMTTSCKKYGLDIPDGYPDDSENIADGEIDTDLKKIDKSMYGKARVFPGLVDQAEPRVENAKFTLDLNFTQQTARVLRISVAPEPQFSTGYYAAPGELIKIDVPAGIEGLSVQIGGHTDNLTGKYPLLREPVVYMRQRLYSGENYVRNLFGGTIYIRAERAYTEPIEFGITNACVSPDFVLGESSDAEWVERVKASHVPWLEFRSKRVVFLIPRDKVIATFNSAEPLTNPSAVVEKWHEVFDLDFNGWMGLSDNAADERDRSPQGAWRGVLDIQLTVGYGHSGFPFVGLNDSEWFKGMTSYNAITSNKGMWGSYHEFGHNCQQGSMWSWSTLGETTNNLFNFKVANRIGADYNVLHPAVSKGFPEAIEYAKKGGAKDFDKDAAMDDPFKRMLPFIQIFEKFGYEAMTHLYTQARHAERLNPNDLSKHNWVFEQLSDYTKLDLSPFFDSWGISYSPAVAERVASKYPLLTTAIWTYNPLNKTGGTEAYIPQTTVLSVSSPAQEGSFANLVDGNPETYYHSKYSSPTAAESYPFTFNFMIAKPTDVKGIFFNGRPGTNRAGDAKNFEVYSSADNETFTKILEGTLASNNLRQEFMFPNVTKHQYFRVIIKDGHGGKEYVVFGEMDFIK